MGDFGLGFLYVKEDLLDWRRPPPALELPVVARRRVHFRHPIRNRRAPSAIRRERTPALPRLGNVAAASRRRCRVAALHPAARRGEHRSVPLAAARAPAGGDARLGFEPQTPAESTSPIVTFAHKDARIAESSARQGQRACGAVLGSHLAVGLQRHGGHRSAAERLVVAARRRAFHNETRTLHVKWPTAPQPGNCVARELARSLLTIVRT